MDRAQWLEERKKGIGGSEAAPILGLSPWKSAYQVWEDKTGLSTGEAVDTPQMAYGRLVEPVLRQWYSNETGRSVSVPELLVHPKHDFIIGSLDGVTNDNRLLEIKTARSAKDWGEPGTDQIPVYYTTQIQHYLMITGFVVADVVVSFAGSIPEIYEVPADPELQEMLLDCEYNFWQMVIQRIPPEPVSYSDMLSRFGGKSIPNSVAATDDALEAWSELKKIKAASKRLETEEAAARAVIMKLLGENDTLVGISGRPLVTWKKSKDSTVFDEERFKAACPKTYSRFQKTKTGSRRFLLKEEK